MPSLPSAHRGPGVFAYLGVPPERRVLEKDRAVLALRLQRALDR
ncbi:MAG TPA: hypothetical protein VNA67_06130 [Pseudonocardiaceae bacterium]|nr:hypothetical protein [Pseudonocardiaceae bacterium]